MVYLDGFCIVDVIVIVEGLCYGVYVGLCYCGMFNLWCFLLGESISEFVI